jgi:hypothetical protein
MALVTDEEHSVLIHRVKRACKVSYALLRVLFVVIIVMWSLLLLSWLLSPILQHVYGWAGILEAPVLFNYLILGLLSAVFVRMMMLVLRDVSKGETPFTRKQSKRVRLISYLMFARVLLELLLSIIATTLHSSGLILWTYPVSVSLEPTPTLYLNLEALIFAIVLYSISIVFEYGALLQRDSDDIL